MPHKCRKSTAENRADSVMLVQGEIAHKFNSRRVNKKYKTLCEGFDSEQNMFFGRCEFLAPEVALHRESDNPEVIVAVFTYCIF